MKKLMTVLAATAMSFGLFADTVETTVNLHGFEVDEADVTAIDAPLNLNAEFSGFKVWSAGETDSTLVKAYDTEHPIPAFEDDFGESYLGIETDGTPLFRGFANSDGDPVNFGDAYVSTYVQFTAADSDPTNIGDDDKIALWLRENEEAGTTNLMVRCGRINADYEADEAVVSLDADIEPNSWHKVTIKPVFDTTMGGGNGQAFFLVYLDDNLLSVKGAYDLVEDGQKDAFSTANQAFINNGQLLPSYVSYNAGAGAKTLSGIAFDGTGAIDNLEITKDDPFPPTYEITAIEPENGTYTVTDEEGDVITAAVAGAEVTITPSPAENYELDTIAVVGADTTLVKVINGVFEMPAQAVTVTVTFKATDPIPPLPVDPQEGDVAALVQKIGFKDAGVVTLIGDDAATYNAFKLWAGKLTGGGQSAIDSLHSADSFLLGLEELLENDPVSEIKTIAKDGDTMTLTFEIKDGKEGDAVAVAQAAADYVKTLVKCNEKVDFGTATEIKDATVNVTIVETTLTATVELPESKESAFMKVAK